MSAHDSLVAPEELFRKLQAELRERIERGEACSAEMLLTSFPVLARDHAYARRLALAEFLVRRELGQHPDPEEWYRRFPDWEAALRHDFAHIETGHSSAAHATTIDSPSESRTLAGAGAEVKPPAAPLLRLGHYELLEEIGRGGMGRVYRARDTRLGREVALKTLRAGILADPHEVTRFVNEARVGARVQHRNIVSVLELDEEDGCHFFTMALAPGGSLAQRRPQLGDAQAVVRMVVKVARAVGCAHALGIVHRDLKPGNILFDDAGEPLVADFGLAKLLADSQELTHTGQRLGTPAYMAPEQAAGHSHEVTPATDVWALGIILHELLTGRRPFDPASTAPLPQTAAEQATLSASTPARLDSALQAIVAHCLARDPAQRYPSAIELADDLERWLQGEKVHAPLPSRSRRAARWLRRHPLVSAVAAGVLGLLLLTPAFYFDRPDSAARNLQLQLAQLKEGKPVTLIEAQGSPGRLRWMGGDGTVTQSPLGDGCFCVHTMSLSCLELLPSCPLESYRLRAKVCQLDSADSGKVGLFCMHALRTLSGRQEHCLVDFTFNDVDARYPRVSVLQLRSFHDTEKGPQGNRAAGGRGVPLKTPRPGSGDPPRWHSLSLVVTPQLIRSELDGQVTREIPRDTLSQLLSAIFLPEVIPPEVGPGPDAQGGMGLLLYRTAAAFRDVVVEPVSADGQ